jgi:hypothetical protein
MALMAIVCRGTAVCRVVHRSRHVSMSHVAVLRGWRRLVVGVHCRGRLRPSCLFAILQRPVPVVVLVCHGS